MADETPTEESGTGTPKPQAPKSKPVEQSDEPGDIDYWKREAKKAFSARDEAHKRIADLELATQSDAEKAMDKARKEGRKEAETEWRERWKNERRTAIAQDVLSDRVRFPGLVMPHLRLSEVEVDDEGEVDRRQIEDTLNLVLQRYPDLAIGEPAQASQRGVNNDLSPQRPAVQSGDANARLRQALGRGR